MSTMDFLTQAAWRGTLVLAAGFAAGWLLNKASAAVRHYLWATVFCALLGLPLAMILAPKWTIPASPVTTVLTVRPHSAATAAVPAGAARPNLLPWLYFAGVLLVTIRFTVGALRTRKMLSGGVPLEQSSVPTTIPVMECDRVPVPLAWGVFRPMVALPATSRHWSPDRMRTVLLHELTHVERRDLLAQIIGQAACCLYWFHPLAWIAAREMRKERERACDDAVLSRGIAPAEYAEHLVDLARGLTVAGPAMAEANDFEGRVRALLDRGRNRAPLTRKITLSMAAMACALILPIGSVISYAQTGRGALAGIVIDPSGARIPNAEVLARNLDGGNQESAVANAAGEYGFRAVPAGRYELQFKASGFKIGKVEATVAAGVATRADGNLEVGEVAESMKITGGKRQPPAVISATPKRIPVGGNIEPLKLIVQPRPEYPAELRDQGVTGRVILRGIVGKDGRFVDLRAANTDVHPGLVKAALSAVSQWQYEPARLNGHPIETVTTVTISFEADE